MSWAPFSAAVTRSAGAAEDHGLDHPEDSGTAVPLPVAAMTVSATVAVTVEPLRGLRETGGGPERQQRRHGHVGLLTNLTVTATQLP